MDVRGRLASLKPKMKRDAASPRLQSHASTLGWLRLPPNHPAATNTDNHPVLSVIHSEARGRGMRFVPALYPQDRLSGNERATWPPSGPPECYLTRRNGAQVGALRFPLGSTATTQYRSCRLASFTGTCQLTPTLRVPIAKRIGVASVASSRRFS